VAEATAKDIDLAVQAASKAYKTSWGLKVPASDRGKLLMKLADLVEQNADELAALESLDNGKSFAIAKSFDVQASADTIRYYGGWCDKHHGKTIEVDEHKLAYTRNEPFGVVGQIIPWNFPLLMFAWKIGPALATGNCIVLKPSEFTPLTAIRMGHLIQDAGFPPGVVNIVTGYGSTVGAAISSHMMIDKVAFTGSTVVGRNIMKAAADSNLKNVTLELGGKSPNIIFDDADLEQAIKWSAFGIYFNHGQCCCAGSRVYVQESIYETFMQKFTEHVKSLKVGDPFHPETFQGPQVSKVQFDRIMGYINKGKEEGATVNQYNKLHHQVPFGGYKQSGIGRELGEYALANYTNVKAVHVNLTAQL
ncbi:aldehyde dehydrogenase (NAD(P)(+)) ald5, partial [Tulasnella sp. 427]